MNIEAVDFFYLSLPVVRDIGDGSQDSLLVRVRAGGHTGWGECEAAPLVSMAAWNCPMSHSACKPVSASVLGERLDTPADIRRLNARVREQSSDLLQADHTLSGLDIALWDLLGRRRGEPVYRLLGYKRAWPKTPYASQLFGDDPAGTHARALRVRAAGFRAAKFGWGPYGRGTVKQDTEHVRAARAGLGPEGILLVDAGTVWGDDVDAARQRLDALKACGVLWLEEPFVCGALGAYQRLSEFSPPVKLAGGEGCHNFHQAQNMIDYAGLGFIQVDAGRIGGLTTAKQVADYAAKRNVQFVNHTFTNHLALSASLQPYAGLRTHDLCEYPFEPSELAQALTKTKLLPDTAGQIHLPDAPGLGVEPDLQAIWKYLVEVEIKVAGRILHRTPKHMPSKTKKVRITDENELKEFVRTHLGHRLTALVSPICRPPGDRFWSGFNDAYRAAKEGSYAMLRLFIEFLGVKSIRNKEGKLTGPGPDEKNSDKDTILLGGFDKFGVQNVRPEEFGTDEPLIAEVHRTLCKINAHFTYDPDPSKKFYDRIASPDDEKWEKAVEIVVRKLDEHFYRKVGQPIVVHDDLKNLFERQFTGLKSSVRGDGLGRPPDRQTVS